MKTKITLIIAIILSSLAIMAQTTIPGGDVYGTWTLAGSPYLIEGDITVPGDQSLVIEPGVTVEYQGSYIFAVYGVINAQGTENDTIYFKAPGITGYRGLHIEADTTVTDSMIFTYCRFQDGNGWGTWPDNCGSALGIWEYDAIRIEHCLFIDNQAWTGSQAAGGAIALADFDGIIRYNTFIDNSSTYGGGIMAWNNTDCIISHNVFYDNYATFEGAGIQVHTTSDPQITHNTFIQNRANQYGGAISLYNQCNPQIKYNLFYDNLALQDGGVIEINLSCVPEIVNNTMVFNQANQHGGAVDIFDESCPLLINNIIWGNQSPSGMQVYIWDPNCIPDFFNNDIQYGKDSITGFHDLCEWKNNIDAYPEFEDTATGVFNLSWISPCLDIGVDSIYDPDGTISDLGAFWFDQTSIGIEDALTSENVIQLSNYPNPFCENTTIRFRLPDKGYWDVQLSVFDISGRRVAVVANESLSAGEYQLNYNASNLPAGIYIMRLQVGGEVLSRKIVKR